MRRDQRRLRLLLILLTLTSLTLVTLDVRGDGSGSVGSLRNIVNDVLGPVESAASSVWSPVRNAFSSLAHFGRDRETAKRLAKENADLQHQIDVLKDNAGVDDQLRALQNLAGLGQYTTVFARVIAFRDVTSYEWTVTIDAGSVDHIHKDLTVISGNGLVGRVLSVSRYTSVVLMIIDPTSTVGARLEGNFKDLGRIDGQGEGTLLFTLFGTDTEIHAGQRVVSFGSTGGSPYVAGVPIGYVSKVVPAPGGLTREALVVPYVKMTALDIVGVVIAPPRVNPRDGVLPQKPKPAPTVTVTATPQASGSPRPGSSQSTQPPISPTPNPSPSLAPSPSAP